VDELDWQGMLLEVSMDVAEKSVDIKNSERKRAWLNKAREHLIEARYALDKAAACPVQK
jgi:hypothetical protein